MIVRGVNCRGDVVEESVGQLVVERPTLVAFRCVHPVFEVGDLARAKRTAEDESVEFGSVDNHRADDHNQPDHRVDHRAVGF